MVSTETLVVAAAAALDEATGIFDWGDLTDPDYAAGACVAASVTVAHRFRSAGLAPQAHILELCGLDQLPDDVCRFWAQEYAEYTHLKPSGFFHAVVALGDGLAMDPTARQLDRYRRRPPIVVGAESDLFHTWHTATRAYLDEYAYITDSL